MLSCSIVELSNRKQDLSVQTMHSDQKVHSKAWLNWFNLSQSDYFRLILLSLMVWSRKQKLELGYLFWFVFLCLPLPMIFFCFRIFVSPHRFYKKFSFPPKTIPAQAKQWIHSPHSKIFGNSSSHPKVLGGGGHYDIVLLHQSDVDILTGSRLIGSNEKSSTVPT